VWQLLELVVHEFRRRVPLTEERPEVPLGRDDPVRVLPLARRPGEDAEREPLFRGVDAVYDPSDSLFVEVHAVDPDLPLFVDHPVDQQPDEAQPRLLECPQPFGPHEV